MEIREYTDFKQDEIMDLYAAAGWTNYTDHPEMLKKAYENSLYISGAYQNDRLVGIIRVVGDGASVVLIQDLLILPEYQRQGIGTVLLQSVMEKYRSVYQLQLLTDDTEKNVSFYRSAGLTPLNELGCLAFTRLP